MSADEGTGGDAPISDVLNNTSAVLKSGSNAAYRHKQTLKSYATRYTAAHPDCRMVVCIQSGYAQEIALMYTYNMGDDAAVARLQNELVQRCGDLSGHTVVARLRRELAGASVEQVNHSLKLLEYGVAAGCFAPYQTRWLVNIVQDLAPDDPIGEQAAATNCRSPLPPPVCRCLSSDSGLATATVTRLIPTRYCWRMYFFCRASHGNARRAAAAESEDGKAGGRRQ